MMRKKSATLNAQTRKMVYDVHYFIKKESEVIVDNLKKIKMQNYATTGSLLKSISYAIDSIHRVINKTDPNSWTVQSLNQTCNDLKIVKEYTLKVDKIEVENLNRIISNLNQNQKRTSAATNISRATLRRIFVEADSVAVFKTPGKKRRRAKPVTDIKCTELGIMKRFIHYYYQTYNETPTVEKLQRIFKEMINLQGSERSFRRILQDMGFQFKKAEGNRRVLIESANVRFQRIDYLKKIQKYRLEGRPIVYTDESFVDLPMTAKTYSHPQGLRIIVFNAGTEVGFLPKALYIMAGYKSDDYRDGIRQETYEQWLRTQLLPNLPPNSVVVVTNAAYHNKLVDPFLSPNSRKKDMLAWLTDKGIECDAKSLKPELFKLIKANKERFKTFTIDKILAEYKHDVLRLPPSYHPDLNPMRCAWSHIKEYVNSKPDINSNFGTVARIITERIALMEVDTWKILCESVKELEKEYEKSDHVIDSMTEELFFYPGEDNSDDDDDKHYSASDNEDDDLPCVTPEQRTQYDFNVYDCSQTGLEDDVRLFAGPSSTWLHSSALLDKEPEEPFVETCNTCKEPLSGVLYVCLQCDYRSCGGCDADGAHQHHYVMRAPATRTQEELEKVLEKVREVLQQVPAQAPPEQCVPEVARTDEDEEEEPYEPSVMIKTEIEIEEQDPFAPENMHDVVIKTEEEDPPEVVPSHSGTSHQRPKKAPANDPNKHVPFTYTDTQIELEEITVKIESPDASDASEASGPPALYLSSQQADQPGKRTRDASPQGDSTPEEESTPKKKGRMKKKTV